MAVTLRVRKGDKLTIGDDVEIRVKFDPHKSMTLQIDAPRSVPVVLKKRDNLSNQGD